MGKHAVCPDCYHEGCPGNCQTAAQRAAAARQAAHDSAARRLAAEAELDRQDRGR